MFQRSMSIRPGQKTPRNFVNRLLGVNFKSMSKAGDWVLKPFMQVNLKSCYMGPSCLCVLNVAIFVIDVMPLTILGWHSMLACQSLS